MGRSSKLDFGLTISLTVYTQVEINRILARLVTAGWFPKLSTWRGEGHRGQRGEASELFLTDRRKLGRGHAGTCFILADASGRLAWIINRTKRTA